MAALVCCLSFSVTSCKSDDDSNNDDEGEVFTDGPQDTQDETVAKFWNVVGELVDKDDITDDYKGKTFDPNFHNAVTSVEDENLGENTVAAVLQKGYTTASGKVIRPAMVSVANP